MINRVLIVSKDNCTRTCFWISVLVSIILSSLALVGVVLSIFPDGPLAETPPLGFVGIGVLNLPFTIVAIVSGFKLHNISNSFAYAVLAAGVALLNTGVLFSFQICECAWRILND